MKTSIPPKSVFWVWENLREPYLWDYRSDDSEDGYLPGASQAYEENVVQACNNSKNDDNSKHVLVTLSGEYTTDGCTSELVMTPKRVTPRR